MLFIAMVDGSFFYASSYISKVRLKEQKFRFQLTQILIRKINVRLQLLNNEKNNIEGASLIIKIHGLFVLQKLIL